MPQYNYVAKDFSGKRIAGRLEMADRGAVLQMLRQKNLVATSITEQQAKNKDGFRFSFGGSVPLSEVVIFTRQLATMIDAGIPILQSLEILSERTEHKRFKGILEDVTKKVAAGSSIHRAMASYQSTFTEFLVYIVKAGEESGHLDEVLDRVAISLEKTEKIVRKVKSALLYPAVVIAMAIVITSLMLIKVIPVFVDMYGSMDVELPVPTQILIQTSDFIRANLLWIGMALFGAVFALRQYSKTKGGSYVMDSMKLRLPVFGELIRKVGISKFSRTLGILLRSGVPILRAMEIVSKTSGNKVIEKTVADAIPAIREGKNLSEQLKASKVFPQMVIRMIGVGEASGELESMLDKVADFYDDEVDTLVAGLTTLLEPLIIAFLGVVIGGIVISMFLPMFQMVNVVSM